MISKMSYPRGTNPAVADLRSQILDRRAFTLFELLIVIGIVAAVAAMAIVAFSQVSQRGRDARRRGDMESIQRTLENYKLDDDGGDGLSYPSCLDCLDPVSWGAITTVVGGSSLPPVDPLSATDPNYDYSVSCDGETCCGCALMEVGGNAYGQSGTSCQWADPGTGAEKNYYCVSGQADVRAP